MAFLRKTLSLGSLVSLAALGSGCNISDTEALATIGRKIGERAHAATEQVQQKLSGLPGNTSLQGRVQFRLRSDKLLADTTIDVQVKDQIVELRGIVAAAEQARRAVDLAESTLGVASVVNSLQITGQGS